jgi:hypothetical protein
MNQRCTNLKRANHATFHWRNQFGMVIKSKPKSPTVHGRPVSELCETAQNRIRALNLFDTWVPVVNLVMGANRSLKYEGQRAQSIWSEFCAQQYGK